MTYGQMLFHHSGKISNNKHIKRAAFFFPFSLQASTPVIVTVDFQRWGFLPDFCCTLLLSSHPKALITAKGLYANWSVYYTEKFWV